MALDLNIKIGSYNLLVQSYVHGNKPCLQEMPCETRIDALVKRIQEMDCDIICLQEVDFFDPLAYKMAQVGYYGLYAKRDNGQNEGCATFYKNKSFEPIRKKDQEKHYFQDGTGRMIQNILFRNLHNGSLVNVLNTHIVYDHTNAHIITDKNDANYHKEKQPEGPTKRETEIRATLELAKKVAESRLPTVVCGDFNTDTITMSQFPWKVSGFEDALAKSPNSFKTTFENPKNGERSRIDYIFSANIPSVDADVYGDPNALMGVNEPSDHLPLAATFSCAPLQVVSSYSVFDHLTKVQKAFANGNTAVAIQDFNSLSQEEKNRIFGYFYPLIKPSLQQGQDYMGVGEAIFLGKSQLEIPARTRNDFAAYAISLRAFELLWNSSDDQDLIKNAFAESPEMLRRDIHRGLWLKHNQPQGDPSFGTKFFSANPKHPFVGEVIQELKNNTIRRK